MKKRTKIIAGIVALALIGGGGIMLNNNYKTNGNIFDFTTREDSQLAYLKEHEQEIVDFVKSVNPKVESVQINWDETQWNEGGHMFETTYFISIYGGFNHLENSSWGIDISYNNEDGTVDLESMVLFNGLRLDGDYFE